MFDHCNLILPIMGERSPKIADLQAHNTSHCDALWACWSAIFGEEQLAVDV